MIDKNKYEYNLDVKGCRFSFVNENDENSKRDWDFEYSHYNVFKMIMNFMEKRGFAAGLDKDVDKLIRKSYYYGKKKELEFKAEKYPRGFKIEFFQNINIENRNGGYYDFHKFKMMPYMIRLLMINEMKHLERFVNSFGITETYGRKEYKLAVDNIKADYVNSCHYAFEDMNFSLEDFKHNEPDYNCTDRDKKRIENGDIKYFRDYKGRLQRGKVYRNLNSMWWVILNETEYTNKSAFQLFDATEEDFKIRKVVNALKTEKLNPKSKKYHNQEYRIGDNLFIINERTGMFKANTDFGNYSYYWSDNDLKGLIIRMDRYYTLNKLVNGGTEVDFEATMKEWKKEIKEILDDDGIDQETYDEFVEHLDEYDQSMSEEYLVRDVCDYCSEHEISDCAYEFLDATTRYTKQVEDFYKLFLQFKEILKAERDNN